MRSLLKCTIKGMIAKLGISCFCKQKRAAATKPIYTTIGIIGAIFGFHRWHLYLVGLKYLTTVT